MNFKRIACFLGAGMLALGLAACAGPEEPVTAKGLMTGSLSGDVDNVSLGVVMTAEADVPAANMGVDPVASGIESIGMRVCITTDLEKADGLTHSVGGMEVEVLDQVFGGEMNTWISKAADGTVTHYSYNPGTFEWSKAVDQVDDTDELVGVFGTNPGLFKDLKLDDQSDESHYIVTGRLDLANAAGLGLEDLAAAVTDAELSPSMQLQAMMIYSRDDKSLETMKIWVDPMYATMSDGVSFTTLSAEITVKSVGDVSLTLPAELASK